MSLQLIPLDNAPNQNWQVSLTVNGATLNLQITLRYNEIAKYWVMTINDQNGNLLLDSIPFISGAAPGGSDLNTLQNILNQFEYLEIGSALIANASGVAKDYPDATDLGTDFVLLWGDNPSL